MAYVTLNNGLKMPQVGFGLWKVPKAIAAETVYSAIKQGVRLFDGACDYGNEKECGQGVARAISEGLVKREELWITSKLWNTFHDPKNAKVVVKKQLADWGLEYFDLYLIHFPIALAHVPIETRYPPEDYFDGVSEVRLENVPLSSTWGAMEWIHEQGLAKAIGVSNYNGALLIDLMNYAKTKPSVLQIEHHPLLTQEPLLKLASKLGFAVTAYSSLGPQSFYELNGSREAKSLLETETIISISQKHNRSPAQVLLRWATQRGLCVIPKSSNPERIAENMAVTDFDLLPEDLEAISGLNQNLRFNDPADLDVRCSIFA